MPKQKPGRSKQDYATPDDLLDAIKKRLRISAFQWDFACNTKNCVAQQRPVTPKEQTRHMAARLLNKRIPINGWTEQDNSFSKTPEQWAEKCGDGWGWLNPPFANIASWAAMCLRAMKRGGARIAFLVPASVGSNWYRDFIHGYSGVTVLFLNGRPSFDGVAGFPKDCMLVLFDGQREDLFSTHVWTWKEKLSE